MKSMLRTVNDHGEIYTALAFMCPGCQSHGYGTGLQMLPVNSPHHQPSWEWDGNLERPTLSPSILTNSSWKGQPTVCHSFLKEGVFQFLGDCTHPLANQHAEIPDLPDWVVDRG